MAATLIYLNNHTPRDGVESDETEKPSSVDSIDCNENPTVNGNKTKSSPETAKEGVKQSGPPDPSVIEKNENNDGANNNNNEISLVASVPPLPSQEESNCDRTKLTSSENTTSNSAKNVELSEEAELLSSACSTQMSNRGKDDKSHFDESSSEDDSSSENNKNNNNKQSYLEIKSKRKTLLKIEKLTDSDNRSRSRMRRRALSPPSSSDDENLYIGWIAYPASLTSFRRTGRKPRREIWMKAVKFIFYPLTKVCQKCIKNKVADAKIADA